MKYKNCNGNHFCQSGSLLSLHTVLCCILILFHLHPDVRSPGADACAVEKMLGKNDDASEVTLIASGLGGVVAIRNKIITLKLRYEIVAKCISVKAVAESSPSPCSLCTIFKVS